MAGHAGTVPMGLRRDALAAAAEMVLAVERRASATPDLVGTVGRLDVAPGAVNVDPGRGRFTHRPARASTTPCATAGRRRVIEASSATIAARRGVALAVERTYDEPAPRLRRGAQSTQLAAAVERAGVCRCAACPAAPATTGWPWRRCARIGMLFVRCKGGISHNPAESITADGRRRSPSRVLVDFLPALRAPSLKPHSMNTDDRARTRIRRTSSTPARPTPRRFLAEAGQGAVRQPARRLRAARRAHGRAARRPRLRGRARTRCPTTLVRANGMIAATNLIVRAALRRRRPDDRAQRPRRRGAARRGLDARTRTAREIVDGWMYGRGVAVSKSDFATYTFALLALEASAARRLNGTVELHFTYDEEAGGEIGPGWLLAQGLTQARPRASAPASPTPSSPRTTAACSSRSRCDGKLGPRRHAVHRRRRARGRDRRSSPRSTLAQDACARARLRRRRASAARTLTVGLIEGGINTNVVPDRVTFRLDRRMIPEENPAEVEAELRAGDRQARPRASRRPRVEVRRILLGRAAHALCRAASAWRGRSAAHASAGHGRTRRVQGRPALHRRAGTMPRRGVPIVLYGAGPRTIEEANAHRADERLPLDDLAKATRVVALTLAELLGA